MRTKEDAIEELKAIKNVRLELERLQDADIDLRRDAIRRLMTLHATLSVNQIIGVLERSIEVIDFKKKA